MIFVAMDTCIIYMGTGITQCHVILKQTFFIIMSSSTSLEKKMEKQAEAMEGK